MVGPGSPDSSFRILLLGGSVFPLLNPPPVAPGRLLPERRKTALARLGASWAEKIAFQEAFKNRSNFDAFSTSIFERLGSVLEGQDASQIHQKSIKIEFPRPSVSASFFTSIFDRFLLPTSTPWISKKCIFPKEKQGFFKKPPFEDNIDFGIDFGANLPPCWPPKSKIFRFLEVPRGLQKFILFRIDFLSILGPSWPPTWTLFGSQDGSKSEKMGPKIWQGAPFMLVLNTTLLLDLVYDRFGLDFGWVRARFSMIFG